MPGIILATINAKWIHPSLALRLLKANLGEHEGEACIMEFALRQPLEEKTAPILAAAPRILGLSVSIWNHTATVELLRTLEGRWKERPLIVLGGPEASHLPAEADIFRYADWVVRGEGEWVFRDLCGLLLSGPDKDESSKDESGRGALSRRIAALPSVRALAGKHIEARPVDPAGIDPGYRLYTEEDLRQKLVYVESSRGCPFGCEFCLSSTDRGVREFPLEPFLGEMEKLIRRGAGAFKFLDRTFNQDIDRAGRIMSFFLERLPPRGKPPFYVHFEMVPGRFPPELREPLTRFPAGSLRLELGIQTLNPAVSARVNRPGHPERELEVLGFLRAHTSAIVHADLIAGLPGEDFASFAAGFDRLWQVRPGEIQLGILKRLPGTPISRHDTPSGMVYAPDPPYEVLETGALPAAALDRIKNFARFWELIVNRNAFADLAPALFPEGEPVFGRFMALADRLLARFGRNWGIDRRDLRAALEECLAP
jgi:radical SAM superfamily enzyme YgiQ (UPF0313 family)